MDSFRGEEPPPMCLMEPKTVRNLSSSSSAFFSANQSPFFSPRTPTELGSLPTTVDPNPTSVAVRFLGSGSSDSNPLRDLDGSRCILPDFGNAGVLQRVSDSLRGWTEPRNKEEASVAGVLNSVDKLDVMEKHSSGSGSSICSSEESDRRLQKRAQRLSRRFRSQRKRSNLVGVDGGGGSFLRTPESYHARTPDSFQARTPDSSQRGPCSASFSSSARTRGCDVYIGTHGKKPLLFRFTKWLRSALESEGIACFAADRARYRNSRSHDIAQRVMNVAAYGVVILTKKSFSNPYTIDELKVFLGKKNLIPIYFDLGPDDCMTRDIIERRGELWEKHGGELWILYDGIEKDWREAVDGLSRVDGPKLDAHLGLWRDCISSTVNLLGFRLGRRSVAEREKLRKDRCEKEEFPFPRNENFLGRKKELLELELMLFGDVNGDGEAEYFNLKTKSNRKKGAVVGRGRRDVGNDGREEDPLQKEGRRDSKKGKEQILWRESEKEIEMQRFGSPYQLQRSSRTNREPRFVRSRSYNGVLYGKGIACVSGESGIGKTELLLEYAYRYAQRYRLVLWVGGEARYFRQNYLSLCSFLGLDVGSETHVGPGKYQTRSFEEQESEAFQRVRRELIRDIPFLVVIDNLEIEKDWWDAVDIMDLLPRFGGATHVLISTRLPRVMILEPLRLSYLSSSEAMSVMIGGGDSEYPLIERDALRTMEEKLGRLPLGLRLVGAILNESDLPVSPSRLLDTINRVPLRDVSYEEKEGPILHRHAFLTQLLDVCFSIFEHEDGPEKLATGIAWVGGWFAPSAVPISLLAAATDKLHGRYSKLHSWKKSLCAVMGFCRVSQMQQSVSEAATMLVRFRIARNSTKHGWIHFHDIIRQYARNRGGICAAQAMVRGVCIRGSITLHSDHLWAACFLLFGFPNNPITTHLKVPELILFIRRVALPLAVYTFNAFSRCRAAMELLHLCTCTLEAAEESLVSRVEKWLEKSFCLGRPAVKSDSHSNANLWHEVTLLKATVLETRAKLMLKSGKYDIGEDLCRTALNIRTVVCGANHPDTISLQETLAKLVRFQTNTHNN